MGSEGQCRDLLAVLSDYIDGDLDPELCQSLEAHMAGCDDCRTVVDSLRAMTDLYRTLPPAIVADDVALRLRRALGLPSESA